MLKLVESTLSARPADPKDNDYHRALVLPLGERVRLEISHRLQLKFILFILFPFQQAQIWSTVLEFLRRRTSTALQ